MWNRQDWNIWSQQCALWDSALGLDSTSSTASNEKTVAWLSPAELPNQYFKATGHFELFQVIWDDQLAFF